MEPNLSAAAEARPFSWTQAIRRLFEPQRPPPGWIKSVVVVYGLNALAIGLCVAIGLHFYAEASHEFGEGRLGTFASVAALIASGIISFKIRGRLRGSAMASFWFAFGLLLCLTAADDLLRFHERIDRLIHMLLKRDPMDTVTNHLDDCIVALYALPAFYQAWMHRRRLIEARLTIQVLVLAVMFFAGKVLFDMMEWSDLIEDSLKQTAGCTIVIAFLATYLQPILPASWTDAQSKLSNDELSATAEPAATPVRFDSAWPWVQLSAAAIFSLMACTLVAALFARAAAFRHHADSAGRMFNAFAIFAVVGAAGFFWVGHFFITYGARLRRSDFAAAGPSAVLTAPAHRAAWRAVAIGLIVTIFLSCTTAVLASRHFAPPVPKRVFKHEKHRDE